MIRLLAVAALMLMTTPAMAQQLCATKDKVIAQLTGKHGEAPMLELGSADRTEVWQLYANLKTGTWSLIGFPSPTVACFIDSGKSIEPMGKIVPGQPL